MKIEVDPVKNQHNIAERNIIIDFKSVIDFDWANALIWQNCRFDYGLTSF
ncbi:hypothetical protein [Actinobacillus porcinus]|nr:hypothetical protein [Actinobacillus porcinus]